MIDPANAGWLAWRWRTDEEALVHGDHRHVAALWCDDRLAGVVDWPTEATGNRGSHVGHCRLNVADA